MTGPTFILMGLRGSGKSTVGRLLADRLGKPFVDLDDRSAESLNAADAGAAIRAHGMDAFRAAEADSLKIALSDPIGVLSLGGGTPTAPGCAQQLTEARTAGGLVVYLHAPPSALASRIRTDASDRPSLTGADPAIEVGDVYLARDPLYRSIASTIVEVENRSPQELAELIAGLSSD